MKKPHRFFPPSAFSLSGFSLPPSAFRPSGLQAFPPRLSGFLPLLLAAFSLQAFSPSAFSQQPLEIAEVSAEIILNPDGDLAKGRPYQGTPSSVVTASGKRLFVVWYGNGVDENFDNYVMLAYGDTSLKNFGGIKMIIRSPHLGKVRCYDPAAWRDPESGRVYISWAQNAEGYRSRGTWLIHTDNPDDPEPAWSEPRRIFTGVMMNKPAYLKNGDILCPVYLSPFTSINDAQTREEGLWIYKSRDRGQTFGRISHLALRLRNYGLEPMLVEKQNGMLWYLVRVDPVVKYFVYNKKEKNFKREGATTDGIYEAFSKDAGQSFSRLAPSPIPHIGSRFHISRLKSGALLLIKNYANDERWLAGQRKAADNEGDQTVAKRPKERMTILAYLSRDDGKTWKGGLVLDERKKHVAYPDASQSDDGVIYVSWDHDRYKAAEIYAARITEADILAGKLVTPGSATCVLVNSGSIPGYVNPKLSGK